MGHLAYWWGSCDPLSPGLDQPAVEFRLEIDK
jgi:hypothetical protein